MWVFSTLFLVAYYIYNLECQVLRRALWHITQKAALHDFVVFAEPIVFVFFLVADFYVALVAEAQYSVLL